jgi:hypothetical protein
LNSSGPFQESDIVINTFQDDGTAADTLSADIITLRATHSSYTIYNHEEWTMEYIPAVDSDILECEVTRTCWSQKCSSLLQYDLETFLWTFKHNQATDDSDGTFVYILDTKCKNNQRALKSFKIKIKNRGRIVSPINIMIPFDIMYEYFQDLIPYEMVKPYGYVDKSNLRYRPGSPNGEPYQATQEELA